jgi:hypothetical protein
MQSTIETTIKVVLTLDGNDIRQLLAELNGLEEEGGGSLPDSEYPALCDLHARMKNYADKFPARQEER